MNAFLLYVVKSAICLSLFYGLYALLLRREAFFRFNLSVLLVIMALSLMIPFIHIPVSEPALLQIPVMQLEETVEKVSSFKFEVSSWVKPDNLISEKTLEKKPETSNLKPETFNLIPTAYFAGFFVSLAIALISFVSVARVIVTARRVVYRRQRILVSPLKINSFNFAGWIVLSEMDYERFAEEIVAHENIHRQRGHFWDLCFVNAIAVIHWFNPFMQFLRREMKALHEYEADRCTLSQGINATRYKLLLIEKAAGASRYSVACGFAQSKIKKRMYMMTKQNLNPWARWKALLFIPLAALLLQAFARPEINRELEQISTLKGTEILQENTDWTEEKFLEELRKCLPEGVSRELSYEDTWKESIKKYGFNAGKLKQDEGLILAMNKNGDMLANGKHIIISDVSDFLAKNLTVSKDGKIIKWMGIQRDGNNTPPDDFQKLLNTVGEAYMQKRNEMSRQYYQTGYDALDAEQKAVVDDIVPILVLAGDRRAFPSILKGPPPPPVSKSAQNNDPPRVEMKTDVNMNVLYLGIDNPLSIAVSGVPAEKVSATISHGKLSKRSGIKYVANPETRDNAIIDVFVEIDGQKKKVESMEFRIQTVPVPIAKVAGKVGGYIDKNVLISQKGIILELENFSLDVKFSVVQFSVSTISKGSAITKMSTSSAFTDHQKTMFNDLKKGQKLYIEDIKVKCPDGKIRDFPVMAFTITE